MDAPYGVLTGFSLTRKGVAFMPDAAAALIRRSHGVCLPNSHLKSLWSTKTKKRKHHALAASVSRFSPARQAEKRKAPRNSTFHRAFSTFFLVPEEGLEPSRHCCRRILSPLRLPVPPFRHSCFYIDFTARGQPSFPEAATQKNDKKALCVAPSLPFCIEQASLDAKYGSDMNDTCQTTTHNGDSLFSDMEESGCQSSDVPLGSFAKAGTFILSGLRVSCGCLVSPVFSPDIRAFPVPEPASADACRCGMVFFPA